MSSVNLTNKEIIERIEYFMKKSKINGFDLSRALGHDRTYFSRIKGGFIEISLNLLFSILDILDVSTFEFFYPNLDNFEKDIAMLDMLNMLNPEDYQQVYKNIYFRLTAN